MQASRSRRADNRTKILRQSTQPRPCASCAGHLFLSPWSAQQLRQIDECSAGKRTDLHRYHPESKLGTKNASPGYQLEASHPVLFMQQGCSATRFGADARALHPQECMLTCGSEHPSRQHMLNLQRVWRVCACVCVCVCVCACVCVCVRVSSLTPGHAQS